MKVNRKKMGVSEVFEGVTRIKDNIKYTMHTGEFFGVFFIAVGVVFLGRLIF